VKEYKNTRSWNPFAGCGFDCTYCKPSFHRALAMVGRTQHCKDCLNYAPHEHPERLDRIPNDQAIFVCEDADIAFARPNFMEKILEKMRADNKKDRIWFLQSKNPARLKKYLHLLPPNTYLATTLETNRDEGYGKISKAPKPSQRYRDFLGLSWPKKIVTVEPLMDFDLPAFADWIESIRPAAVFIGFNSRPNAVQLREPDKKKMWQLIHALEDASIRVLKKEMRDGRVRKCAYRDFP
jgi:hypothetical protein